MPPKVTFTRFAICSGAFAPAYALGAFPTAWHVPGYAEMTLRTKLLQCLAEAALFLLPAVGLLTWAFAKMEPAALRRFRELNLFVEYVCALATGAIIGALCALPFVALGIWFPAARNVAFALAAAGGGGMILRLGIQSRQAIVFRIIECVLWMLCVASAAWLLLYR